MLATAYDTDNPMPEMMYQAVERLDIEVRRGTLRAALQRRYPLQYRPVVHLHWIGHLFRHESALSSVLLSLRYIALLSSAKVRRFKIVWTLHNDVSHGSRHGRIERVVRAVLVRWLTDGIIAMTQESATMFAARYGNKLAKKVHVVPHPGYRSFYGPALSKAEARRRFGLGDTGPLFLFFGQVREYKDVGGLEEAFKHLECDSARLILAGACDPEDTVAIHAAAVEDERILVHLERVPDDDVADLVSACDWVVLPYREASNSGVLLLALSYERPVVAPAIPTLIEVLGPDLAAACYRRDEPDALRRALAAACDGSREQALWEQRAAARGSEFPIDDCAEALAGVYATVASRR